MGHKIRSSLFSHYPKQKSRRSGIFLAKNAFQLRQQFFGLLHDIFSRETKQFEQFTGWR